MPLGITSMLELEISDKLAVSSMWIGMIYSLFQMLRVCLLESLTILQFLYLLISNKV